MQATIAASMSRTTNTTANGFHRGVHDCRINTPQKSGRRNWKLARPGRHRNQHRQPHGPGPPNIDALTSPEDGVGPKPRIPRRTSCTLPTAKRCTSHTPPGQVTWNIRPARHARTANTARTMEFSNYVGSPAQQQPSPNRPTKGPQKLVLLHTQNECSVSRTGIEPE